LRFSAPCQHPVSSRGAVACNQSDFVFLGKPCMGRTSASVVASLHTSSVTAARFLSEISRPLRRKDYRTVTLLEMYERPVSKRPPAEHDGANAEECRLAGKLIF
jgi:hypothetical protein